MNSILDGLPRAVSDWSGKFTGAFNIRENGECAGRQSTKNIRIESKTDKPGLDIRIRPGTKGETVSIPACVTHGGVDDLVYNDFFVGEGADVTIVAGCGVHTDSGEQARHNGIHRFFLEKGARVTYLEKHVGTGKGEGVRSIDPVYVTEYQEFYEIELMLENTGWYGDYLYDYRFRCIPSEGDADSMYISYPSDITDFSESARDYLPAGRTVPCRLVLVAPLGSSGTEVELQYETINDDLLDLCTIQLP